MKELERLITSPKDGSKVSRSYSAMTFRGDRGTRKGDSWVHRHTGIIFYKKKPEKLDNYD